MYCPLARDPSGLFPLVDERHDLLIDEAADGAAPFGMGVVHMRAGGAKGIECQSHARERGRALRQVKPSRGGIWGLARAVFVAIYNECKSITIRQSSLKNLLFFG